MSPSRILIPDYNNATNLRAKRDAEGTNSFASLLRSPLNGKLNMKTDAIQSWRPRRKAAAAASLLLSLLDHKYIVCRAYDTASRAGSWSSPEVEPREAKSLLDASHLIAISKSSRIGAHGRNHRTVYQDSADRAMIQYETQGCMVE